MIGIPIVFVSWKYASQLHIIKDQHMHHHLVNFSTVNISDHIFDTKNSEWYRRWNECDSVWLSSLYQTSMNKYRQHTNQTCLYSVLSRGIGTGNKLWINSIVFFVSSINYCQLEIDWGWPNLKQTNKNFGLTCCDPIIESKNNDTTSYNNYKNIFSFIFNDNSEFVSTQKKIDYKKILQKIRKHNESKFFILKQIQSYAFMSYGKAFFSKDYINQTNYCNFIFPTKIKSRGISFDIKTMDMKQFNKTLYFEHCDINDSRFDELDYNFNYFMNNSIPMINKEMIKKNVRPLFTLVNHQANSLMEYEPIARFFGLLVLNLNKKYRDKAIKFVDKEFTNYFVFGVHIRIGNGEKFAGSRGRIKYVIKSYMGQLLNETSMIINDTVNNMHDYNYNYSVKEDYHTNNHTKHTHVHDQWSNIKIYIATDTIDAIDYISNFFQRKLNLTKNQIVYLPQSKQSILPEGVGHLYTPHQHLWSGKNLSDTNITKHVFGKKNYNKIENQGDIMINFKQIEKNASANETRIDCVENIANGYLDSEILGFTDMLILPTISTLTRHSRLLMYKRKKTICIIKNQAKKLDTNFWYCYKFANQTLSTKNYTYQY